MFYFHQFYSAMLMEYARNSKDRYALLPGYDTHFMTADVKEEYIKVNGSRIFHRYHYDEKNKSNIVMLHGWSFTSLNWQEIGSFEKFNYLSMNAYAFDYPGFGKSPPSETYRIERGEISNGPKLLRDYMKNVGLSHAHIMGASMGGGMVLKAGYTYADIIDSIIAVAPAWVENDVDNLKKIRKPVLMVWGSDDTVVPPSLGKKYLEAIKGSRLEIVAGSKHPVYIEKAEEFFKIVSDFLTGKGTGK